MSYKYNLSTGLTRVQTNTKKYIAVALVGLALVLSFSVQALAAKPTDPGCFGTDRANILKISFIEDGGAYSAAPGASAWGAMAGDRAGTNGDQNLAYKTWCGGDPTTP